MNQYLQKIVRVVSFILICAVLFSSCARNDNFDDAEKLLSDTDLSSDVDSEGAINSDQWIREQLRESGYTDEEINAFFAEQEAAKNDQRENVIYTFTIDTACVTSVLVTSEGVRGPTYQYSFTPENHPDEFQKLCDIVDGEYQYIGTENELLGGAMVLDLFDGDELLWHISFSGGDRIYYENGFYVQTGKLRELEDIFDPYYTDENLK